MNSSSYSPMTQAANRPMGSMGKATKKMSAIELRQAALRKAYLDLTYLLTTTGQLPSMDQMGQMNDPMAAQAPPPDPMAMAQQMPQAPQAPQGQPGMMPPGLG